MSEGNRRSFGLRATQRHHVPKPQVLRGKMPARRFETTLRHTIVSFAARGTSDSSTTQHSCERVASNVTLFFPSPHQVMRDDFFVTPVVLSKRKYNVARPPTPTESILSDATSDSYGLPKTWRSKQPQNHPNDHQLQSQTLQCHSAHFSLR